MNWKIGLSIAGAVVAGCALYSLLKGVEMLVQLHDDMSGVTDATRAR